MVFGYYLLFFLFCGRFSQEKLNDIYRPGFSATHILPEINFGSFWNYKKIAILTIWAAPNFEFLGTFNLLRVKFFQKPNFKDSKIVQTAVFDFQNLPKLISRKIRAPGILLNFHTVKYPIFIVQKSQLGCPGLYW